MYAYIYYIQSSRVNWATKRPRKRPSWNLLLGLEKSCQRCPEIQDDILKKKLMLVDMLAQSALSFLCEKNLSMLLIDILFSIFVTLSIKAFIGGAEASNFIKTAPVYFLNILMLVIMGRASKKKLYCMSPDLSQTKKNLCLLNISRIYNTEKRACWVFLCCMKKVDFL